MNMVNAYIQNAEINAVEARLSKMIEIRPVLNNI